MKGCQLPAVEKKVELGIGLLAIQAKTGASINKSKEPIEDTNGQKQDCMKYFCNGVWEYPQ